MGWVEAAGSQAPALSRTPLPSPRGPRHSRPPEPYGGRKRPEDHPSSRREPRARVRTGGSPLEQGCRGPTGPDFCPRATSL